MTDDMRTLEIVMTSGRERVRVPATWRITYGPVIGAAGKSSYGGNVLRIWEGRDHQRGLWNDVVSFRDVSIERLVAAVRRFGTEDWYRDDGSFDHPAITQLVEHGWQPEESLVTGRPDWLDQPDKESKPSDKDDYPGRYSTPRAYTTAKSSR